MLARWTHCRVASFHKLGHIVDKLNWAWLLLNSGSLDFTRCTFGATSECTQLVGCAVFCGGGA
jgi:hypothetical protein